MKICLSAPSKTFLLGEYAVLVGGPALILNTAPRFELRVQLGSGQASGFSDGSPAHKWLRVREPVWADWDLEFADPHTGAGGFGASGAQFLLAHTFTTMLQSSFERTARGVDWLAVWRDQQVLSENQGSGADLLAQTVGQVARIDMSEPSAKSLDWPYPELAWSIVRTHQKIPTHLHLESVNRDQIKLLMRPAVKAVQAFGSASVETFVGLVKDYSNVLVELGLQSAAAQTLVRLFNEQDWCLVAKGCGALGADTVLVFYQATDREKFNVFLRKQSLAAVASNANLSGGVEIRLHGAEL